MPQDLFRVGKSDSAGPPHVIPGHGRAGPPAFRRAVGCSLRAEAGGCRPGGGALGLSLDRPFEVVRVLCRMM